MQDVLTLILGGGRGTRLYPLTQHRSEPAVPLAGKYRLIDVPLSSCLHSSLSKIYVLTQFLSVSLHRHIAHTYNLDPFNGGFIEVLAAQQTNETTQWYGGTADALRQHRMYIEAEEAQDILILYADQIYRMDFQRMIQQHRRRKADITVAVLPVTRDQTSRLGILKVGQDDDVLALSEAPHGDAVLADFEPSLELLRRHEAPISDRKYLANMGIYLFRRRALLDMFDAHPNAMDLVKDLMAPGLTKYRIQAHFFDGYWEDMGTIPSYFAAHMAFLQDQPSFDFHATDRSIFTRMRNLPAARISDARIDRCLLSDGSIIHPGASLERSIIGIRSEVGRNVRLKETILIGADQYEQAEHRKANQRAGIPNFGVGEGSIIERAILDKDCRIGKNVRIQNEKGIQEADAEQYVIRDGIVVVPNGGIIPDNTVI